MNDENPYASPGGLAELASVPDVRAAGKRVRPYRSPFAMATVVTVGLFGFFAMAIVLLPLLGAQLAGAIPDSWFVENEFGSPLLALYVVIGGLQTLSFLFTAVAWCFWLYRVHSNLPALGARRLQYTSGWAVGWNFVPIASFVMPFLVIKEVWFGSLPGVSYGGDTRRGAPLFLGAWWVLFLVSRFASRLADGFSDAAKTPSDWNLVLTFGLVFGTLDVVLAVLAWHVVRTISNNQDEKARQIADARVESSEVIPI